MSNNRVDTESTVSGNHTKVPAQIRRELDIDDGDRLRWEIETDGSVRVEVVHQRSSTFADFDGYDGDVDTDGTADHDQWGID